MTSINKIQQQQIDIKKIRGGLLIIQGSQQGVENCVQDPQGGVINCIIVQGGSSQQTSHD